MANALTVEKLSPKTLSRRRTSWLRLLLKAEAWLDDRASRHDLYRLDDAALADLGLSQADVERINGSL